jgi:predicted Rdx family selenoprotein
LKSGFSEETEIRPGATGQFDVIANGKLIFSKKETGRFPNPGEVERRFAALKEGKELPPLDESKPGFVGKILEKLRG